MSEIISGAQRAFTVSAERHAVGREYSPGLFQEGVFERSNAFNYDFTTHRAHVG